MFFLSQDNMISKYLGTQQPTISVLINIWAFVVFVRKPLSLGSRTYVFSRFFFSSIEPCKGYWRQILAFWTGPAVRRTQHSEWWHDLQNARARRNVVDFRCHSSTPGLQSHRETIAVGAFSTKTSLLRLRLLIVHPLVMLQIPDSITTAICSEAGFETSDPRM